MTLAVRNLTLRRGDRELFSGLDFAAAAGHRIGVVGPNGCGKTTLFHALTGNLEPDAGEIEVPSNWRVAMAAQESPSGVETAQEFVLGGNPVMDRLRRELKCAEEQHDGEAQAQIHARIDELGGYDAVARAGTILAGLGFDGEMQERSLDAFSGGWRARLALARALYAQPDVLLLDEPTNHLDLETIDWLVDWCIACSGVILAVSHDRDFLDRFATNVLWIDRPAPRYYVGGLSEAEVQRAQILENESARNAKNSKRAADLQAFVDRFRAKATKAKQAQSRLKMLERLEISAPLAEYAGYSFEFPQPERLPTPLIKLDHADIGYGDTRVLSDVHLSILPGDRIGILGRNGSGKSTLIKALAGSLEVKGRHQAPRIGVGYFAQHQLDQLVADATPLEHMTLLAPDASEQRLRDYLGSFGFHGDHAVEPIAPRSGGEKSRLALALLAWKAPQILLLDEPTNHLDLQMRDALAVALRDYRGAVLIVSHDRAFMTSLCDDYLSVDAGRVRAVRSIAEGYVRATPGVAASTGDEVSAKRRRRQQSAAARERRKPLSNRVRRLEKDMEATRTNLDKVRAELADPELYASDDPKLIKGLSEQSDSLERALADLEEQWFEAQEELEALGS